MGRLYQCGCIKRKGTYHFLSRAAGAKYQLPFVTVALTIGMGALESHDLAAPRLSCDGDEG